MMMVKSNLIIKFADSERAKINYASIVGSLVDMM